MADSNRSPPEAKEAAAPQERIRTGECASLGVVGTHKRVSFYTQKPLDSLNPEKPTCASVYSQREEIMNTCKQFF